jgi:hypothetical protein
MYYRGSLIHFAATFTDANGAAVTPTSAKLKIKFKKADGTGADEVLLDWTNAGGGNWTKTWNSSVAQPGVVKWSTLATDGTETIAQDGSFTLSANSANPAAA